MKKTTKQLKHDWLYLQMANTWSQNSSAVRAKVGAIIVSNSMIIADGYNGMPTGFDNCCEVEQDGELTTHPYVLHAESNAISKLARRGSVVGSNGAALYCTYSPCIDCAKLIVQAGIRAVHFSIIYRIADGIELLLAAGIDVYLHQDLHRVTYEQHRILSKINIILHAYVDSNNFNFSALCRILNDYNEESDVNKVHILHDNFDKDFAADMQYALIEFNHILNVVQTNANTMLDVNFK